jgi:ribosomal protein S25
MADSVETSRKRKAETGGKGRKRKVKRVACQCEECVLERVWAEVEAESTMTAVMEAIERGVMLVVSTEVFREAFGVVPEGMEKIPLISLASGVAVAMSAGVWGLIAKGLQTCAGGAKERGVTAETFPEIGFHTAYLDGAEGGGHIVEVRCDTKTITVCTYSER